jgi:transposase
MSKKKHAPEFKREAVHLARQPGMSLPRAARELGVHVNTLREWARKLESGEWEKAPGAELKSEQARELERLRREVAELKMERDILKKAAAYFAKESK